MVVYEGTSLRDMRLLAITSDAQVVADVAERLLELDERATRPARRAKATLSAQAKQPAAT